MQAGEVPGDGRRATRARGDELGDVLRPDRAERHRPERLDKAPLDEHVGPHGARLPASPLRALLEPPGRILAEGDGLLLAIALALDTDEPLPQLGLSLLPGH